jgi:copper chaperone CopZ
MELEGIEGVEKINVDLNTKKASVTFNPPEVEQTILKTLTEIGYPAES